MNSGRSLRSLGQRVARIAATVITSTNLGRRSVNPVQKVMRRMSSGPRAVLRVLRGELSATPEELPVNPADQDSTRTEQDRWNVNSVRSGLSATRPDWRSATRVFLGRSPSNQGCRVVSPALPGRRLLTGDRTWIAWTALQGPPRERQGRWTASRADQASTLLWRGVRNAWNARRGSSATRLEWMSVRIVHQGSSD